MNAQQLVAGSAWAAVLTPEERGQVQATLVERQVPAGGYVARMGEPATHWIGLAQGLLKMSVASADGAQSTLSGLTTSGWFGEGSLLKPHEPRRYDVVALRPCTLALVPRATFETLRQTSLPFNHFLQQLLNARMGQFIGMLEAARLADADGQVASCLASLFNPDLYAHPPGASFVDLRQAEIGLLCGLSRQRVNKALQRLQEAQLLRVEPRGITVLDIGGLRGFSGVAGRR